MPRIATRCIACQSPELEHQPAVLMPFVAARAFGWEPCEVTPEWGLRDLPIGHAHALCATLHCAACGMLFLDMRFDNDELSRLYRDYRGAEYEAQRESFEPGYAQRNQRLLAGDEHIPAVEDFLRPWLSPSPKILDWGGDTGLNTPLRREARIHHVLDISGKPLIDNAVGVDEEALQSNAYDLVVLSNVLEHVPEPLELLARVSAALETGKLYVEVPFEPLMQADKAGEVGAWRRKRHWHEHINYFSAPALQMLLHRCGLEVLKSIEIPTSTDGKCALAVLCRRATQHLQTSS